MRRYFLGMAANYGGDEWARHTFAWGRQSDYDNLKTYLARRYGGEVFLCKNGRSALALALKTYFEPGDAIIVNGFTCYAVYEAIRAAKMRPVFADISKQDLNFNVDTLSKAMKADGTQIKGIIVQNTLGNPVDIKAIEKFAKEHGLLIIEDLAHAAGVRYKDGREAGKVGVAAIWSFGKDKSIDTISGGALVLRSPCKYEIEAPNKTPKLSDHLRARFYPTFGALCRGLSYIKLGGALMRGLVKIHWVEKSADNALSLSRLPSKYQAKLALAQFKQLRRNGEPPIREFCFVNERDKVLAELQKKGYYFGGFWYEKPVSPKRYYKKVNFPETSCPNAVWVAQHIINLPRYYTRRDLTEARNIIKNHLVECEDE